MKLIGFSGYYALNIVYMQSEKVNWHMIDGYIFVNWKIN